jgi:hypothetical protein
LKKIGRDPLFAVNHTAAMIRDHVSRLVRKTWCTTKKRARLRGHLLLYAVWHNKMILESLRNTPSPRPGGLPVPYQQTGPPV